MQQPPAARQPGLSLAHFLAPALTLGVGLLVGMGVFFTADAPDSFLSDRLIPYAALLAALAAAVGLLLSWGELDLSSFGILAMAGFIYIDVNETNVAAAILLSALAGLFVGLVIGVLRWLTRAPSGLVSLAGGLIASTLYMNLRDLGDPRGPGPMETIDGPWIQLVAGGFFVAAALLLAVLLGRPKAAGSGDAAEPELRVIPGFAVSGAAAGVVGAVILGWWTFGAMPQHWTSTVAVWLLPIFAAVAIGGVLRGNWFLAPIGAALGAVATALLSEGGLIHRWDRSSVELLLMAFLMGSLVVSYGLHRILDGGVTAEPPATPPPPSQPVPF